MVGVIVRDGGFLWRRILPKNTNLGLRSEKIVSLFREEVSWLAVTKGGIITLFSRKAFSTTAVFRVQANELNISKKEFWRDNSFSEDKQSREWPV